MLYLVVRLSFHVNTKTLIYDTSPLSPTIKKCVCGGGIQNIKDMSGVNWTGDLFQSLWQKWCSIIEFPTLQHSNILNILYIANCSVSTGSHVEMVITHWFVYISHLPISNGMERLHNKGLLNMFWYKFQLDGSNLDACKDLKCSQISRHWKTQVRLLKMMVCFLVWIERQTLNMKEWFYY